MNVCESLTRTARRFPERIALISGDLRLTYAQLDALSVAAAIRLTGQGVTSGDRVALMLPNTPVFAVWYYAALRIGAVAVSVSTRLVSDEIEYILSDCDARVFVTVDKATSCLLYTSPSPRDS